MGDLFTSAVAVVILAAVALWRRPVRPIAEFSLALLTGVWIWANLRDTGWQQVFNEDTPEGLDPVTKSMFWRGWPLAPVMFCVAHGMRFRPTGFEGWVLIFDWLVLFLVLCLARFVWGRWFHWRDGRQRAANSPRAENETTSPRVDER